jgi:hypothetical protein
MYIRNLAASTHDVDRVASGSSHKSIRFRTLGKGKVNVL